jgi:two-component system invasion response regulator UvrY
MNNDPIRIILVDDHKLVRQSWRILLETNPRFAVIAECDNGTKALELAKKHTPDVMLVDINMAPMNGFVVTQKIVEKLPSIRIIGLSVNNLPNYALRMLKLGAKGYLTKTSPLEEITEGIIQVFNGQKYVCEEIKRNMGTDERKKIERETSRP